MKIMKKIIIVMIFAFALFKIIIRINDILMPDNDSVDSLRTEKADIDVMFFGSSHAFANINPVTLWEEYGIAANCVASGEQPIPYTYYSMKEAFKIQKPKVAVVELYMAVVGDDYFDGRMYAFYLTTFTNFRPSLDKLEIINKFCKEIPDVKGNEINAVLGFPGYHQGYTWKGKSDFEKTYDKRGFEFVYESNPQDASNICPTAQIENGKPLSEWGGEYLPEMIELCDNEGVELVFLVTPYCITEEHAGILKTASIMAEEEGVPFVDMNNYVNEIGIDYETDMCDWGHLNNMGSEKASKWLGKYLVENYGLRNNKGNYGYRNWERLSEIYEQLEGNYWIKKETQLEKYLQYLDNGNYLVMILANNGEVDISIKMGYLNGLGIGDDVNMGEAAIMLDDNVITCIEGLGESNIVTCGKDTIGIMKTENGVECKINNTSYAVNGQDRIVVYDKLLEEVIDNVVLDWENGVIAR